MSTTLTSKSLTYTQRTNEAVRIAGERLHVDDAKRLLAAIAEIAAEELGRNPSFALRVRGLYEELAPSKPARAPSRKSKEPAKVLVPVKQIDSHEIDVSGALDPYFLLEVYGEHQLADALEQHPPSSLREAVEIVQERHPGTRPSGRSKTALIAFIVQYTTKQ